MNRCFHWKNPKGPLFCVSPNQILKQNDCSIFLLESHTIRASAIEVLCLFIVCQKMTVNLFTLCSFISISMSKGSCLFLSLLPVCFSIQRSPLFSYISHNWWIFGLVRLGAEVGDACHVIFV